jgi:dephospho-CoA kinase
VPVIGLTGGIASGKSAAEAAFAALGAQVADADRCARALVARGQPALDEIVAGFGPDVLAADGALDRAALRARIFADAQARRTLEAILHPRVREALRDFAFAADRGYVLLSVPLLVETGVYPWLDRVLVVDAPEALQMRRLLARDGVDETQARATLAAQATRWQRLEIAHDVVINDADLASLRGSVARLHERYASMRRLESDAPRHR